MNMNPSDHPLWDEQLFQLLARVIDAVVYEQKPGVKTILVAEYLARTARAEFAVLTRRRRRARMKSPWRLKSSKR